jgi:uncharacterized protein HemY
VSERRALLEARVQSMPSDRFARYALALDRLGTEEWEAAEADLRRVVAEWPDASAAWLQLGRLLGRLGREAEAAAVLRDGLAALEGRDTADARRGRRELRDELDGLE